MPIDPVTLSMAAGSALNAGGQIFGGLMGASGQMSPGDMIMPYFDPSMDAAFMAQQFDALNMLGFGNIYNNPGPYQELIGRINKSNLSERTKRRAQLYVQNQMQQARNQPLIRGDDPNYRRDRWIETSKKLGVTDADLASIISRQNEFEAQRQRLSDAGLGKLNEQTILGRAQAAASAAQLAGAGASFATSGDVSNNPLIQSLLDRDNRQLQNLEQRLGMMANFGGLSPANFAQTLSDAQLDQQIRVLEQALGASAALSGALQPGQAANANNGQLNANAAQIVASQAQAANQLRAQIADNQATSLANGVSGGLGALGSDLSSLGGMLANQRFQAQQGALDREAMSRFYGGSQGFTAGFQTPPMRNYVQPLEYQ